MVVQDQAKMGEGSANPTDPHHNRNTTLLDAERDRGNINKTQSKATPNKAGSQGTTSGGGPRRQETIGDTIAQTRLKSKQIIKLDEEKARIICTILKAKKKNTTAKREEKKRNKHPTRAQQRISSVLSEKPGRWKPKI
ncbi:hypothetical protein Tco_0017718 [Tanacetum coccineum]